MNSLLTELVGYVKRGGVDVFAAWHAYRLLQTYGLKYHITRNVTRCILFMVAKTYDSYVLYKSLFDVPLPANQLRDELTTLRCLHYSVGVEYNPLGALMRAIPHLSFYDAMCEEMIFQIGVDPPTVDIAKQIAKKYNPQFADIIQRVDINIESMVNIVDLHTEETISNNEETISNDTGTQETLSDGEETIGNDTGTLDITTPNRQITKVAYAAVNHFRLPHFSSLQANVHAPVRVQVPSKFLLLEPFPRKYLKRPRVDVSNLFCSV